MSADPIENAVQKINGKLTCLKCSKFFEEPKLLPCFHVFCKSPCLERLAAQDPEGKTLTCPTCEYRVTLPDNGVAGLPKDFQTENMFQQKEFLEKAKNIDCGNCTENKNKATVHCQQCEVFMCPGCTETHNNWGPLKNHQITDMKAAALTAPSQVARCARHGEILETYCNTCPELICSKCTLFDGSHNGHECKPLEEIFPDEKAKILTSLETLKQKIHDVNEIISKYDTRANEINNESANIEGQIEEEIGNLIEKLQTRQVQLKANLKSQTEEKLDSLDTEKKHVETILAEMSRCVEYAEAGLKTGTEGEVLGMKESVLRQIDKITTKFNPDTIQPKVEADFDFITDDKVGKACKEFGEIGVSVATSFVTGRGVKLAEVNTEATVEIHPRPVNDVTKGLSAKLTCAEHKITIKCIYREENGRHLLTYKPVKRGAHKLHVKINGKHIQGSPYSITVIPSLASKPYKVMRGWNEPYGITINSKQEIIIAGHNEDCITIMGDQTRRFGDNTLKKGCLKNPYGIAVDNEDNIYVVDNDKTKLPLANDRILKFDSTGNFLQSAGCSGPGDLQFHQPVGICFNKVNQWLYICDQNNHRIQVLTTDLTFVRAFGHKGNRDGQFDCPLHLAFDSDNNLYVTDSNNMCVQVFTSEGEFLRAFSQTTGEGKLLCHPNAIAIDSNDVIYVSENDLHRICRFTKEGEYIDSFGDFGKEEGEFRGITGLCVISNDRIVVCDCHNNRLQFF